MSLVEAIKRAGIIGCGGAGFPTHVKVDSKVELVLANGAECEPLLNTDQRVMEHYADDLVTGLTLIMQNVEAPRGVIGLKESYHTAIAVLSERIADEDGVELGILPNTYPSGDEQIMLTELTGKIVPEGGIPLQVGAVISNVLTMVQVARALRGEVVTNREVTIVGEVKNPQVVTAPIGTPVADILALAKPTLPVDDLVIVDGGPMMGKLVEPDDAINKTTSGLIVLEKNHPLIQQRTLPMPALVKRSVSACCQCRECTELCSRYMQGHTIEPHLMMRSLAYENPGPTWSMTAAFICSQCGLCEFACPMDLSPRRAYAELLAGYRESGMKNPHTAATEAVHEFRQYRKVGKDRLIRRYRLGQYESHSLNLTRMDDPPMVRLSLTQAIGAPSEPVVEVGQSVNAGDLVARAPEGKLGANLHASVSGNVTSINSERIVIEGVR